MLMTLAVLIVMASRRSPTIFIFLCLFSYLTPSHGNGASPIESRYEWDGYGLDDVAIVSEIDHSIQTAKHWIHLQEVEEHQARHARSAELHSEPGRRDPYTLSQRFGFTKDTSKVLARAARVIENVTQIYGEEKLHSLCKRQIQDICNEAGFTISFKDCPVSFKYRTSDGSCNNPLHVNWGKSFTPFQRELPPDYDDGISEPRKAVSGNPLPSARQTSDKSINFIHIFEDNYTTMVMNIGQFLDHDTDHSSTEEVDCKHCQRTDKCLPIAVMADDLFFRTTCIPFARSIPVPASDCLPGPRQQVNQVTSFLDLSQVYGSTHIQMEELRDRSQNIGQLHTSTSPRGPHAHPHLPPDEEHKDCFIIRPEEKCGHAGDVRAAEQPGLTSLHTIFFRQHNKIARELSFLNPLWSDETLFQETRRIMIAIWQHIIYNEQLPALLGRKTMSEHKLRSHPTDFFYGYDTKTDPSVTNVFAHAAYRMGHSQVPPTLWRVDINYEPILPHIPYHAAYFNATYVFDIANGGLDGIVRGMLVDKLPKVDGYITTAVTRHLFADPVDGQGIDLVALNIQRGRDHGLPSYTAWRRFCGIPTGAGFNGLQPQLNSTKIAKFRNVYETADDIDAFTAMIMEQPLPGALVGETLACLLGRQFHNLKYGDRFWYENGLGEQAFTSDQLQEIRKMSLSRLLCDNLDEIDTIQPYPLMQAQFGVPPVGSTRSFVKYAASNSFPDERGRMPGFFNGRISCRDLDNMPRINLTPWKETMAGL